MTESILPNNYEQFRTASEDCLVRLREIDLGIRKDVSEIFTEIRRIGILTPEDKKDYGELLGKPYQAAIARLSYELRKSDT
jgi:type IV secretory pathway VirB4 component